MILVDNEFNSDFSKSHENISSLSVNSIQNSDDYFYDDDRSLNKKDIIFEEEILRDPYSVKVWRFYIGTKINDTCAKFKLYQRALSYLPCSYLLWWNYLQELKESVKNCSFVSDEYKRVNSEYERCLLYNGKMPMIWIDYALFLEKQKLITKTRRVYNSSLMNLCITQHHKIWEHLLNFVRGCGVDLTAFVVFKRYLMLEPTNVEYYINFLIERKNAGRKNKEIIPQPINEYFSYNQTNASNEAALLLCKIADDSNFVSIFGKTNHELWKDLCELICTENEKIKNLNVEKILLSAIKKFTDEVASFWCSLAEYFIRLGLLEKGRDIYEEALNEVLTVKDFSLVFDTYANFEERLIHEKLRKNTNEDEIDLHLYRLENLLNNRGKLLSSVKLKQNPHNVNEWLARVKLFEDDPIKVVETYRDAVSTIDPLKATGRYSLIFIHFAKFYESYENSIENSRVIFFKATQSEFKTIDQLASIWCEWVEMEIRHGFYKDALMVARQAINKNKVYNPDNMQETSGICQKKLYKSVRLWSLCADIEECFGTHETVVSCYEKMISLKVITPQLIINYAHYLEENRYYEDSFKVYEKGVDLFCWPQLNDIWLMYLHKLVERYGGKKLERAREIFQQAISSVPQKFAKRFYLLYAKLEENYGLIRHALKIYREAIKVVDINEKYDLYMIYISKTAEYLGITKTREIFEDAIDQLPEDMIKTVSLQYAKVERTLGEVDRARAVYQHASQFCPPIKHPDFWKTWREFEVMHGSEDTFRDMLRMKRNVTATYVLTELNSVNAILEKVEKELPNEDGMASNAAKPLDLNSNTEKTQSAKAINGIDKVSLYETVQRNFLMQKSKEKQMVIAHAQEEFLKIKSLKDEEITMIPHEPHDVVTDVDDSESRKRPEYDNAEKGNPEKKAKLNCVTEEMDISLY